jgi:hypothetical protein
MVNDCVKIDVVSDPGYYFASVIREVTISGTPCLITTIGIVATKHAIPITRDSIIGNRGLSYNSDSALYLPADWPKKRWYNDAGEIKTIDYIDFEHVKAYTAKDSIATKPVYIMTDGTTSWMVTEVL